jgi:hypothetical protein
MKLLDVLNTAKPKVTEYEFENTGVKFAVRTLTLNEQDKIADALANQKSTIEKLKVTLDFGVITGWRNLTNKALEEVAKIDVSGLTQEELNQPFEYSPEGANEALSIMADKNPGFALFLLNSVSATIKSDLEKAQEQKKT